MRLATSRSVPAGSALLRLGRVSNLPTVWTNVLAATVLAGAQPWTARTLAVMLAMSLFYLGGMYLNDAFDRDIDARERPFRPIPAGELSAQTVFASGFAMLGCGVVILTAFGTGATLAGLALAAVIIVYDVWHKNNPISPVIMGACRALVYVGAALAATGQMNALVLIGAGALWAHVVGLTYAAKQEALDRIGRLWPLAILALPLLLALPFLDDWLSILTWIVLAAVNGMAVLMLHRRSAAGAVPRAVVALITAIPLVDALFAATTGAGSIVAACFVGYALTRGLQRLVPGT